MYPQHYFALFPPFPRELKIFVAMSFDDQFKDRWLNVVKPAIEEIRADEIPLQADRVDTGKNSGSILTEILGGIANDLAVFVDVTAIGKYRKRGVRSPNVMYELGIAQAVRLPEEVIVFSSDTATHSLPFDVAHVRVHHYDPDKDPDGAKLQIKETIIDALKELELKRHLSVKRAAKSFDLPCYFELQIAKNNRGTKRYEPKNLLEAITFQPRNAAIARLLEIGALETNFPELSPSAIAAQDQELMPRHTVSRFGDAILLYLLQEIGAMKPENFAAIQEVILKGNVEHWKESGPAENSSVSPKPTG